jgi:hypothetical protein
VCRALVVVCLAPDEESLRALKRAAVAPDWELAPGATTTTEAVAQIEERRAHVLVAMGPVDEAVRAVRERWPGLRVVVVGGDGGGATVAVASLDGVRDAVRGLPPAGGPVRA